MCWFSPCIIICTCTCILGRLFFCINSTPFPFVCSVFIGVSDREERHGNIRKLKEKKRNDDDLANYKEWLKRASKLEMYIVESSKECQCSLQFI